MSSAPPPRVLVNHKYGTDGHLPTVGEVIIVRLSEDLFGPGSTIQSSRSLPSRVTRHNYHHAVVLRVAVEEDVLFTVLPMPAYFFIDPASGLTSTSWLLEQPDDFQQLHIPVPYEEAPTLGQTHPPFPTPARFGDPLQIGGWKNRKPSWVQAVAQVTTLKYSTTFKTFEPPAKMSQDEIRRLREYSRHARLPVVSSNSTMPPFSPGTGGGATTGGPDASPPGGDTVPGSSLHPHQPGGANDEGGAGISASTTSLALQALYANDAVKYASTDFEKPSMTVDSGSDDDDDDDWED